MENNNRQQKVVYEKINFLDDSNIKPSGSPTTLLSNLMITFGILIINASIYFYFSFAKYLQENNIPIDSGVFLFVVFLIGTFVVIFGVILISVVSSLFYLIFWSYKLIYPDITPEGFLDVLSSLTLLEVMVGMLFISIIFALKMEFDEILDAVDYSNDDDVKEYKYNVNIESSIFYPLYVVLSYIYFYVVIPLLVAFIVWVSVFTIHFLYSKGAIKFLLLWAKFFVKHGAAFVTPYFKYCVAIVKPYMAIAISYAVLLIKFVIAHYVQITYVLIGLVILGVIIWIVKLIRNYN